MSKSIRTWIRPKRALEVAFFCRTQGMDVFFCCGCETLNPHNYCVKCRNRLERGGAKHFKLFQAYSLYDWRESSSLKVWIESLKGGSNQQDWHWIAGEMVRLFGYTLHHYPTVWIVAGPRTSIRKDHAGCLAEQIARILGQPLGPIIYKESSYKQRLLSRKERFKIKLHVPEINTWSPEPEDAVLLVDDVITTGGTAESVYRSLRRPSNFFVWTLANRGLSCGAATHLL